MHVKFATLSTNVILITLLFPCFLVAQEHIPDKVAYECAIKGATVVPVASELYHDLSGAEKALDFDRNRTCVLWLKSYLVSEKTQSYVIQIQNAALDWIQPWVDGKALLPQGSSLPICTRSVRTHLPTWVIPLQPGLHQIEMAIIDTTGRRRVQYTLAPVSEYLPMLESRSFIDGTLLGLLLFNILTAIILAVIMGSNISGVLYACAVSSTTIYLAIASGHAYPLLFPGLPRINDFVQQQAGLIATVALTFWALKLQETKRFLPRWNLAIHGVAFLLLGLALLLPLCLVPALRHGFEAIQESGVPDILSILCLLIILGVTLWQVRFRKHNHSAILLAGLLAPVLSIVFGFADDLGIARMVLITRIHLLEVSVVIMFAIFSGMLAFRLYKRIKESTALEHRFSTMVVQTADRERERLARELHDDIGQRLVALQYQLYNANVSEMATQVREILKDLRHMAHGLHPAHLINSRLGDALETYARDLEAKGICQMRVLLDPITQGIEGEYALHLLRIFQEITTNALRHGNATMIQVDGCIRNGMQVISVRNDGLPLSEHFVEGLGFTSIRTRMRLLGGFLEIHSQPQETSGPILTLTFPC